MKALGNSGRNSVGGKRMMIRWVVVSGNAVGDEVGLVNCAKRGATKSYMSDLVSVDHTHNHSNATHTWPMRFWIAWRFR